MPLRLAALVYENHRLSLLPPTVNTVFKHDFFSFFI